ncbi:MAG: protein kinase domain-containing protein [Gemmatimonadaceae bacterium]
MTDVLARLEKAVADRYSVTGQLGQGGMATVYLAEDVRHHRKVAIKVLHPELSAVLGGERFLKEIELTANLQHPHILPLFDSGTAEGLLYYVMPYVDGETLRERLTRERQLPIPDAVRIASDVADALEYAHKRGVVHRDIKPENILLQDGRPLVADFGIALAVQQAGGERMTQTGLSLGTPQYMSPEQATGEREIDARSDIYSLGAVTYEMLTGEPPFSGPTSQAIVAKVITTDPGSIAARRKSVPAHVEDAVLTALEKVPADRFGSAAEFARALAEPGRSTQRTAAATRSRSPRWPRQNLRALGGAVVGALIVGGIAGWMGRGPAPVQEKFSFVIRADSGERLATACCSSSVAISPDGRRIVYNVIVGSTAMLVTRRLDEVEAHPIPGTESGRNPTFSPDGEWIAFQQGAEATRDFPLKKVPVGGGAPAMIAALPAGLNGLTWMPDGNIVFSMVPPAAQGLFRVSADGGTPEQFARPDSSAGETNYRLPSRIPGSDVILFNIQSGGVLSTGSVMAALTPSGRVIKLPQGSSPRWSNGFILFTSVDGSLKARRYDPGDDKLSGPVTTLATGLGVRGVPLDFDISENGNLIALGGNFQPSIRIGADENSARTLPIRLNSLNHFDNPRFSPDGRSVSVAAFMGGVHHLYLLDLAAGTSERVSSGKQVEFAEWARDGSELIYVTDNVTIVAQRPNRSGGERTVWKGDGSIIGRFSPYGPWIAFVVRSESRDTGGSDLMLLNRDSGTVRPYIASSFGENSPAISPDGKWLAYTSDETGREEVYVAAFPDATQGRHIVSNEGGSEPVWARNGDGLYYRATSRQVIKAGYSGGDRFTITSRTPMPLIGSEVSAAGANYDIDPSGREFVFAMTQAGQTRLLVTIGAVPAK